MAPLDEEQPETQVLPKREARASLVVVRVRGPLLLVDDNPDVLEMLTDILCDEGYRVIPAMNGREALSRVEEELPCLILLSGALPDMEVRQFMQELHTIKGAGGIPVFPPTVRHSPAAVTKRSGAGGERAVPFNFDSLIALLDECECERAPC